MKCNKQQLIEHLMSILEEVEARSQVVTQNDYKLLNHKNDNDTWSVLENLEHICRYGRFYIPEIKKRISIWKGAPSDRFKSGILGDYFAKSMLPTDNMKKMKTFKSMNPSHSNLDNEVVTEYFNQISDLKEILTQLDSVDMAKVKTSISISKLIKLRLGDTLRVVIYHMLRHVVQSENAVMNAKNSN